MEINKLCKELSNWDLPEDLWPGILSRLPVKSLLRFRTVSKSWLDSIDNPEFARLHLKNFRNNADETHLESNTGVIYTLGNVCNIRTKGNIVCSVDGLILLSYIGSADWVWNPSIRKFRKLPSLPKIVNPSPNTSFNVAIGMGYDELAKDYKVIKFLFAVGDCGTSSFIHSVAVFTLATNLWKIIEAQGTGGAADFSWLEGFGFKSSYQSLYFRGCLYWFGSGNKLVSFGLSSELFSSRSLPVARKHGGERKLGLVDGGRTIAAFYYTREEHSCSVWALNNESMMWERHYTFELQYDKVLHMQTNGEILVQRVRTKNGTAESSEYKVVQEKRSPYYSTIDIIPHVSGWVESLILLHK